MSMYAKCKGKGQVKTKFKRKAQKQAYTLIHPISDVGKGKVVCFHCSKARHWRKHHKAYLKSKNKSVVLASGIFVTKINTTTSMSWVVNIRSGSHICFNMQELRESRLLTKEKVDQYVGNWAKIVVSPIWSCLSICLMGLFWNSKIIFMFLEFLGI